MEDLYARSGVQRRWGEREPYFDDSKKYKHFSFACCDESVAGSIVCLLIYIENATLASAHFTQ